MHQVITYQKSQLRVPKRKAFNDPSEEPSSSGAQESSKINVTSQELSYPQINIGRHKVDDEANDEVNDETANMNPCSCSYMMSTAGKIGSAWRQLEEQEVSHHRINPSQPPKNWAYIQLESHPKIPEVEYQHESWRSASLLNGTPTSSQLLDEARQIGDPRKLLDDAWTLALNLPTSIPEARPGDLLYVWDATQDWPSLQHSQSQAGTIMRSKILKLVKALKKSSPLKEQLHVPFKVPMARAREWKQFRRMKWSHEMLIWAQISKRVLSDIEDDDDIDDTQLSSDGEGQLTNHMSPGGLRLKYAKEKERFNGDANGLEAWLDDLRSLANNQRMPILFGSSEIQQLAEKQFNLKKSLEELFQAEKVWREHELKTRDSAYSATSKYLRNLFISNGHAWFPVSIPWVRLLALLHRHRIRFVGWLLEEECPAPHPSRTNKSWEGGQWRFLVSEFQKGNSCPIKLERWGKDDADDDTAVPLVIDRDGNAVHCVQDAGLDFGSESTTTSTRQPKLTSWKSQKVPASAAKSKGIARSTRIQSKPFIDESDSDSLDFDNPMALVSNSPMTSSHSVTLRLSPPAGSRLDPPASSRLGPPAGSRLDPPASSRSGPPAGSRLDPPASSRLEPPAFEFEFILGNLNLDIQWGRIEFSDFEFGSFGDIKFKPVATMHPGVVPVVFEL
ncbi:hypothetical protein BS47DRAFT_1368047 [Hydnum rufescens UP504]|uniref:Uncharacterized protein n=1 Tax=Hydnum rufescens UP504 TaxID=1448309 RepID=A0A9P6DNP4_9AGAM|nr:hypothetical protein BS47DRAFT_1368047 [Hydnum rufescens UP504]